MPDNVDIKYAIGLKPEEAIQYFKSKGIRFSWNWKDTLQEAHVKAFTVAKALRLDVLQDIKDMLEKSLEEGIPFSQFKKELEPRLKAKGWWGKTTIADEKGVVEEVRLGSPYRLKTIYQTNMQTSYMAGRYKQLIDNVDDRPYWQYVAVLDSVTRPSHRALNGKIFRYDDPFWNYFFPPNDYNCRCRVRALTEKEAGKDVESTIDNKSLDVTTTKVNDRDINVAKYTIPGTDTTITTGKGWAYNPGKKYFSPFVPQELDENISYSPVKYVGTRDIPPIESLPITPISSDMLLPPHQKSNWSEEEYINIFLSQFGTKIGNPVVYKDKLDDPIVISEELFLDRKENKYKVFKADREEYLLLLADTIKEPSEIFLFIAAFKDNSRIVKRYIKYFRFPDKNEIISGFSVFDLINNNWRGTTIFQAPLKYTQKYRKGLLLYVKKP